MAWRGLHLSRPSRLSLSDGHVVIAQDQGESRLPLEDLAWLVLDTPQASLTAALLSACAGAGVAVIFTDSCHMPNGILLPFHTHYRQASVAATQLDASRGLRGRLWRALVRSKILNQASVLRATGSTTVAAQAALSAMAARVQPADPDNVEARAAREYWRALFVDFVRAEAGDPRNAMLNYAYAVLRGAVARALVASGFLPCVGLHHAAQSNAFNLADDLIEPFRPLADLAVWRLTGSGARPAAPLSLVQRQQLAGLLLLPVLMAQDVVTILIATEMAAAALLRALEAGNDRLLLLPTVPLS